MSILFIDGFDHYATADIASKWTASSSVTISSTSPRTGVGKLLISSGGTIYKAFDDSATYAVGVAISLSAMPTTNYILIAFYDSSTTQVDLRITSEGALQVTRNGTELSISSNGIISTGTWYYIEFKVTIGNTGNYYVNVNSNQVTYSDSADTQNTSNSYANRVYLISSGGVVTSFDDLYITNGTTFLGDCKISTKFANANGTNQDFTPSTGIDHYSVIDDATPNSDTDYLYSTTVNHKDTNAFEDISITGSILGLQLSSFLRKDDAGSRTAAPVIRSGTTDYIGTSVYPGNSYIYYRQIYETDPDTSIAWTQSGVNNAEYGIKLVA